MTAFASIPVADIVVGERLRRTDAAWVEALAATIADQGLLQPIEVATAGDGAYRLVAGAHRLAAVTALGRATIEARVVEASAAEQRLHEILENVVRRELTKLDRARALAELKAVYEELYPQKRHGGDRKSEAAKSAASDQVAIFAVRSEIAETVGLSDRAIRLAIEIWNGLSPESRERLPGTALADHQASLKLLAAEHPETQREVLDLMLSEPPQAATVADALTLIERGALASGKEKRFRRALAGFTALPSSDRLAILTYFEEDVRLFAREKGWIR